MAGRHSWDGREISDLPAEILNYSIKDVPRTVIRELAMRLNKDSITGNWEILAEKLGFIQTSVLDRIIEEARVQNTYPGLLMLQEWFRRPGSTAFVLLHALREIQREDVVTVLVEKLFELHSLLLMVSVQDSAGVLQFLQVGTRKSAPLHASLENILQHPLYWYDIVGPRRDIDWNTTSGLLQGVQLTLRLRNEPDQESINQIYGTVAANQYQHHPSHHPNHPELAFFPATSSASHHINNCGIHPQLRHNLSNGGGAGGGGGGGDANNNFNLNTSSSSNNNNIIGVAAANQLSGSGAGLATSSGVGGGVGGGGGGAGSSPSAAGEVSKCVTSKLVLNIPPPGFAVTIPCDGPAGTQSATQLNVTTRGPVRFRPNIPVSQPQDNPPPRPCGPRSASPHVGPAPSENRSPESILEDVEPMTDYEPTYGLPNLSAFATFPSFSSERDSHGDYGLAAPYLEVARRRGDPQSSLTLEKERYPTSCTDVKQPLSRVGGCRRSACENDETRPKQPARPNNMAGQSALPETQAKCKSLACSGGASSSLHPEYVAHDSIQFWNNPASPANSMESPTPSPTSTLHNSPKDLSRPDTRNNNHCTREELTTHLLHHHHHHQHLPTHFLGSQAHPHPAARHPETPPLLQGLVTDGGYVAHSVIERMSECHFRRTASEPALDVDAEEHAQMDHSDSDTGRVDEGMDYATGEQQAACAGGGAGRAAAGSGSPAAHVYSSSLPAPRTRDSPARKPTACTYSLYRPDLATETPPVIRSSDSIHQNPPRTFLDDAHGYIDMNGTRTQQPDYSNCPAQATAAAALSPNSFIRHKSEQDLDNFFFPRDKSQPLPCGELFLPRNRRPMMGAQENEVAMEGEAGRPPSSSSSSDYTYIDPRLVRRPEGPGGAAGGASAGEGSDGSLDRGSSAGSRSDNRRRSSTERPDIPHRKRFYHRELSATELEQVPGWNPLVTSETVEGEMDRYINDDGNFVVWRYTVGGKYVISVSHLRSTRHYAVYETEKQGQVYYYIFPRGPRFTSLELLVRHLMEHGVSEPTKTFKTPDGKEATSSRSGVGFSHVRLRAPIPRRRRN